MIKAEGLVRGMSTTATTQPAGVIAITGEYSAGMICAALAAYLLKRSDA